MLTDPSLTDEDLQGPPNPPGRNQWVGSGRICLSIDVPRSWILQNTPPPLDVESWAPVEEIGVALMACRIVRWVWGNRTIAKQRKGGDRGPRTSWLGGHHPVPQQKRDKDHPARNRECTVCLQRTIVALCVLGRRYGPPIGSV